MNRSVWLVLCLSFVALVSAQEAKQVPITSFEDGLDWKYTGNTIPFSIVETAPLENGVTPVDGNCALYVEYDTTAEWNGVTLSFPTGADPVDLTGMREIHMWVYFLPDSTGNYDIRFDLPGGANLGTRQATKTGEWQELVWKIDRLTSDSKISAINYWGGFICPSPGGSKGALYIDKIFAVRPAGIPEIETVLLYGFNEKNADNDSPKGWTKANGPDPLLGTTEVTPTEGTGYMEMFLTDAWVQNIKTIDARADFDRWADIVEILVDVMVSPEFTGSWAQSAVILQSGNNSWDAYPELGYGDAREWRTILWEVDMSRHVGAFDEGGWFILSLQSNNDSAAAGQRVFFDNMRVSVVKKVAVKDWYLF